MSDCLPAPGMENGAQLHQGAHRASAGHGTQLSPRAIAGAGGEELSQIIHGYQFYHLPLIIVAGELQRQRRPLIIYIGSSRAPGRRHALALPGRALPGRRRRDRARAVEQLRAVTLAAGENVPYCWATGKGSAQADSQTARRVSGCLPVCLWPGLERLLSMEW